LTVKWEKLGRCIVKFCKPIDLNERFRNRLSSNGVGFMDDYAKTN